MSLREGFSLSYVLDELLRLVYTTPLAYSITCIFHIEEFMCETPPSGYLVLVSSKLSILRVIFLVHHSLRTFGVVEMLCRADLCLFHHFTTHHEKKRNEDRAVHMHFCNDRTT